MPPHKQPRIGSAPESISISADENSKQNPPPIFQLHHDVVSFIFSLNADMELETEEKCPALRTLRHTSQVCSRWRELVIGSPSLWAHVLNTKSLCEGKEEWGKEVLRRTGAAFLHIKLVVDQFRLSSWALDFAECLLNDHWSRIRNFEITGKSFWEDENWLHHILERPAPTLEVFKFSGQWWSRPPYRTKKDFTLFANMAPSLHTLSVVSMILDLATFSIDNLRHVVLVTSMPIPDLLNGLSRMPFLESFEVSIRYFISVDETQPLPKIILPRLASIKCYTTDSVDAALFLLAHIAPATGCALNFAGDYQDLEPDPESLDLYREILSAYSGYCTDLATATNLKVELNKSTFNFAVNLPCHRCFSFCIEIDEIGDLPEHTVDTLLSSIATIRLDTIRTITLEIHLDYSNYPSLVPESNVANFIEALVSVEEVQTNPDTLKFLNDMQNSNPTFIILPKLKLICLDSVNILDGLTSLGSFLRSSIRKALGGPVEPITLRIPHADRRHLKSLEEFHGLKIQMSANGKTFQDYDYRIDV